ncbi:hypothetical protein [Enterococcus sp. DIV0756]|uniref:hypothetical protein n=1 Tax=Enterococcus sp. DIV0756 TaxID=2774636 RepID=UPI003F686A9D
MVYMLLTVFGLGLLVNSYLIYSVMKKQRELQELLSRMRRKKAGTRPMPPSSEKRGGR